MATSLLFSLKTLCARVFIFGPSGFFLQLLGKCPVSCAFRPVQSRVWRNISKTCTERSGLDARQQVFLWNRKTPTFQKHGRWYHECRSRYLGEQGRVRAQTSDRNLSRGWLSYGYFLVAV